MLTYETKNKISDLLIAISDGERQIEVVRQILAEQEEFEPYAAFRRIDRQRNGLIGVNQLQMFFADNKVDRSEKAINAFIHKYDSNRDGYLNYNEFLIAVLPMDNPTLRTLATQRPNYDVARDEYLPNDVEYALLKVLEREITFYTNLDYQKFQLINRSDYNNVDGFNAIDRYRTGKVDYESLKMFFRHQASFPYDEELIAILRRIDKDDDGIIRYDEYAEAIEPVDMTLKDTIKPTSVRYSSPLKRSSPRKIARSDVPAEKSPVKKSISPIKIQYPHSKSSPLKVNPSSPLTRSMLTTSPLRNTVSPLKKVASPSNNLSNSLLISPNRKLETSQLNKSTNIFQSPIKKIEEDIYTQKLMKSLDRPEKKEYFSPEKKAGVFSIDKSSISSEKTASFSTEKELPQSPEKKLSQSPEKKTRSPEKKAQSPTKLNASPSRLKRFDENPENYALILAFKQFLILDRDLELGKQDLSLRTDFNLIDFFRVFDIDGKGALTTSEFDYGMRIFGYYPNKEDLYLFFRRFDRDIDGKLRFSDFSEAFTPMQVEYASLLNNRTPLNIDKDVDDTFSPETRRLITKLFKLHLENETETESSRQRLNKRISFNVHDAFNYIDVNQDGYLTPEEVTELCYN